MDGSAGHWLATQAEESKEEEEQERAIGGEEEEKCWQQGVVADGNHGTLSDPQITDPQCCGWRGDCAPHNNDKSVTDTDN